MGFGPVACTGCKPDGSCKIDRSIKTRFPIDIHVADTLLPAVFVFRIGESLLDISGLRIDNGGQPVIRVTGNRGRAVRHLIGIDHLLSGVDDRETTEGDRIAAVLPVIIGSDILRPKNLFIPVLVEDVLIVRNRIRIPLIEPYITACRSFVETKSGRFGRLVPLLGIIGLGDERGSVHIPEGGHVRIPVVKRRCNIKQHTRTQAQRSHRGGTAQIAVRGHLVHIRTILQQLISPHAVLGNEFCTLIGRGAPDRKHVLARIERMVQQRNRPVGTER